MYTNFTNCGWPELYMLDLPHLGISCSNTYFEGGTNFFVQSTYEVGTLKHFGGKGGAGALGWD